jgi:hypothetical protein
MRSLILTNVVALRTTHSTDASIELPGVLRAFARDIFPEANEATEGCPFPTTSGVNQNPTAQETFFVPFVSFVVPTKKPRLIAQPGFCVRCLAVTYFRMGRPHTIIGAERFHFRVRDGIGWFPLAIAARQTCTAYRDTPIHRIRKSNLGAVLCRFRTQHTYPNCLGLYGQAARAISTG